MSGFRSLNNSTSKRVLNLLHEPVKLTVWKVMTERVTGVKFRVNCGGGNGAGCFEVNVWADTAKFTDVIVARKCSALIREGKVFVENKTKVVSGVSCSERAVLYFRELLFKSNKEKFSFRRVESEKISSHPRRDLLWSIL